MLLLFSRCSTSFVQDAEEWKTPDSPVAAHTRASEQSGADAHAAIDLSSVITQQATIPTQPGSKPARYATADSFLAKLTRIKAHDFAVDKSKPLAEQPIWSGRQRAQQCRQWRYEEGMRRTFAY